MLVLAAALADGLAPPPANSSGAHAAAALAPPLADPLAVGAAIDASLAALSPAEQERLLLTLACGRASEGTPLLAACAEVATGSRAVALWEGRALASSSSSSSSSSDGSSSSSSSCDCSASGSGSGSSSGGCPYHHHVEDGAVDQVRTRPADDPGRRPAPNAAPQGVAGGRCQRLVAWSRGQTPPARPPNLRSARRAPAAPRPALLSGTQTHPPLPLPRLAAAAPRPSLDEAARACVRPAGAHRDDGRGGDPADGAD